MRIGANGAMFFALLVYAAIIWIAVRIIKYFIRYGIDSVSYTHLTLPTTSRV